MPFLVIETDKTIAMKLPLPHKRIHYLIIPKKDIKDIGKISEADTQYLTDAFFVARQIIEQQNLSRYEIYTNGPGLQTVTYLHFHLVSK
jgi:diadenosine tetraphosphate (Ap4A) HIT family hydrolase